MKLLKKKIVLSKNLLKIQKLYIKYLIKLIQKNGIKSLGKLCDSSRCE